MYFFAQLEFWRGCVSSKRVSVRSILGREIRRARLAEWVRANYAAWRELPVAFRAVLGAIALVHAVGLFWGLPASDTWDVDGIAPRDFVPGFIATYTPGDYFTYPPLHLFFLTLLSLPVLIAGVASSPSLDVSAVIATLLAPTFMTPMAVIARLVSVAMSVGLAYAVGGIAHEIARVAFEREEARVRETIERWAAPMAALLVSVGAPLSYYAHVTNLDIPACCWMMVALREFVRALARNEPHRLFRTAAFAVAAITTKDQAYAAFVLTLPVGLFAWWRTLGPEERKPFLRVVLKVALLGGVSLLFIDGAITNPTGFLARVRFLGGPASKDYAIYSRDALGRAHAAWDVLAAVKAHYGSYALAVAAFAAVGVVWKKGRRFVVLAPVVLALSFTLFFNFAALRTEERFVLPQMIVVGMYAGIFVAYVLAIPTSPSYRWLRAVLLVFPLGMAVWGAIRVDITMLADPRYRAEEWLRAHASPGDTIEMEGLNPYLLRPTSSASYVRISREPGKNPLPGYEERKDDLSNLVARAPRFVVTNSCYTWRFRQESFEFDNVPPLLAVTGADTDAVTFLNGLESGGFGYERVLEADGKWGPISPFKIHGSLGCIIRIFEHK